MMLNRDSVVLWLGIAGAAVTYLLASPPPTEWVYQDYLRATAFVVATISGKLATSPLPSKQAAAVANATADIVDAHLQLKKASEKADVTVIVPPKETP